MQKFIKEGKLIWDLGQQNAKEKLQNIMLMRTIYSITKHEREITYTVNLYIESNFEI